MKVLGISGSPRENGNTDCILNQMLKGAEDCGMEIETIFLRDHEISFCNGCERCRKDLTCTQFSDGMDLIYPKLEEADILITGSPVYNYNITGQMKAFIDRLYPYYIFSDGIPREYSSRLADKKRSAIVFCVSEQTDPKENGFAIEAMSMPLQALGYEISQTFPIYGFFNKGAVKNDNSVMQTSFDLGRRLGKVGDFF